MSNALIALFMAAGVSAFVYAKMGARTGYGNKQSVLTLVGISFVLSFLAVFVLLKTLVNLS